MIKSLRENPILAQQMRHARWPLLRTAVWIAAALTVIGLALTITVFAISPDCIDHRKLCNFSLLLIFRITGLLRDYGPGLTAIVAVVATVQAANSQAHQMMRLSQLSEHDIVSGYVAGVVFRLRGLWMIYIGLVLPQLVNLIHYGIVREVSACVLAFAPSSCVPPKPSDIFWQQAIGALIITVGQAVYCFAWHWLATTLGIWMAFFLRYVGRALAGTLLPLAIVFAMQAVVTRRFYAYLGGWPWRIPVALSIAAMIEMVLGWLAYRQAVKCVRSASK